MKKAIKLSSILFGFLLFTALAFTSCRKDTDPADRIFFTGKYSGDLEYRNDADETHKKVEDGTVTITKEGKHYQFFFSDGIPNITGVKFDDKGDNKYESVGSDKAHFIKIDEDKLQMLYHSGDETWIANATRN